MSVHYSPRIVTDGLVLYLDAANPKSYPGSGTTWYDLSGNGNNGSLLFDGSNDYIINSSMTNAITGNSARTISLWVYPITNLNVFVQLGDGGGGNQIYSFQYYRSGSNNYLFTDGINGQNNLIISGSELPTINAWNYLTFASSGQNWYYYKNGIFVKSGIWTITINTIGSKFVLGKRIDVVSSTLSGTISIVKLYNRALSAIEILQNFNAIKTRYGL